MNVRWSRIVRGVTPDEAEAIGDGDLRCRHPDHRGAAEFARSAQEHRAAREEIRRPGAGRCRHRPRRRRGGARYGDAGGRIIVSPDTNTDVIAATAAAGLISSPGYFTPSEAFAAIEAGATALKLFPAEGATPGRAQGAAGGASQGCAGHRRRRRSGPTTCGPGSKPVRPGSGSAAGLYQPGQSPAETARQGACLCRGAERMKPIRIAIIGYGKIAADQHVPSISANPRFELVATSSRSGQGVGADLHRLARTDPQGRWSRSGRDHDAARAALRDRARMHRARDLHCLLEKPPTAGPRRNRRSRLPCPGAAA